MQEQQYAMGMWKFSNRISNATLNQVAQEWAKDPNYLQLYLRKASKDQIAIGFTYKLPEDKDTQVSHDEYFFETSDILKRQFGNDLVGWDISSPVWIIK